MSRKKNKEEKILDENSFLYKYKNDSKFKAKVELCFYGVFILIIVIYINIASMNNYSANTTGNNVLDNRPSDNNDSIVEESSNLLQTINNNYSYDINIDITLTSDEVINYKYSGKSDKNNIEINKDNITFYKVDDYYYKKESENYILAKEEEIYDYGLAKYVELNYLQEYINKASLDYVTDYSSGKNEYSYNLLIRDIVVNNKTEETININVIEENELLTINANYSNLIKVFNDTIKECKVSYTYSNINKVEEFNVIDILDNTNGGETNE